MDLISNIILDASSIIDWDTHYLLWITSYSNLEYVQEKEKE